MRWYGALRHADRHPDRHADGHANLDADTDTDQHPDRHSDQHCYGHAYVDTDTDTDQHRDGDSDQHVDPHGNRDPDRHDDRDANQHADRNTDRHWQTERQRMRRSVRLHVGELRRRRLLRRAFLPAGAVLQQPWQRRNSPQMNTDAHRDGIDVHRVVASLDVAQPKRAITIVRDASLAILFRPSGSSVCICVHLW
jgi:hypothetical protein